MRSISLCKASPNLIRFALGFMPSFVVLGDFNKDGVLDGMTTNPAGGKASPILGTGTAGFLLGTAVTVGTTPIYAATADFNSDGKLDVVIANSGSNNVSLLLNTTM